MLTRIGIKVSHPIWGRGHIIDITPARSRLRSKAHEAFNLAIRFDNGGPMGFAFDATNDINDLVEVTE